MKYGVAWSTIDSEGYYTGQNGYIDIDRNWASEGCTCPMEFDTLEDAQKWADYEMKHYGLYRQKLEAVCLGD